MVKLGFALSILSVALLVAGPVGTRTGLWAFPAGLGLVALAMLFGLAGAAVSLVGGVRAGTWTLTAVGIGVGLLGAAVPGVMVVAAWGAPAIHDITTDPDDPPAFLAVLSRRGPTAHDAAYDGPAAAAAQRRAYPDIQPLVLPIDEARAFERARRAAESLGWEIVAADPVTGRIEGVATTRWFGFEDDVVVRVVRDGGGARVDVRSKSRVGVGDMGANAARIRAFLAAVQSPD